MKLWNFDACFLSAWCICTWCNCIFLPDSLLSSKYCENCLYLVLCHFVGGEIESRHRVWKGGLCQCWGTGLLKIVLQWYFYTGLGSGGVVFKTLVICPSQPLKRGFTYFATDGSCLTFIVTSIAVQPLIDAYLSHTSFPLMCRSLQILLYFSPLCWNSTGQVYWFATLKWSNLCAWCTLYHTMLTVVHWQQQSRAVFTARCTLVQSAVMPQYIVRPSVCNV